jgi:hypothetical protein
VTPIRDAELAATIHAGQRWAGERDLPDPVKWADLAHAPSATISVIRGRMDERCLPARAHTLPQPKTVAGELRPMTVADPFDEIMFRVLVGRAAGAIDDALGDEVNSYRLVEAGPGWTVRDYTYARDLRIDELRQRASCPGFAGLGTLDVRKYYPSIDPSRLGAVLTSVGVPEEVADPLIAFLYGWHVWGVEGVPIGPEASGLLGNAYLLSVDAALRGVGVDFGRYTDDYRIWVPAPEWADVHALVDEAVRKLGLCLNTRKTRHMHRGADVLSQLTRGDLDELSVLLRLDPAAGLLRTYEMFDEEVASPAPDGLRLKFLLGVLRAREDSHGLQAVVQRPELLQADPKAWARYLVLMHGRGLLDMDWLLAFVTAPVTPHTASAAYHLLRVCTAQRLGRAHGDALMGFATDSVRDWVPVRCAAAEAWANADGYKPTVAAEAALAAGDPQQRRALVLTMRHSPPSTARDKALTKLDQAVVEVRPSVQWIRDGHELAA